MTDDMGTFRVDVEVENPGRPGQRTLFRNVLVATGAEYSVFPASALAELGIEPFKGSKIPSGSGSAFSRGIGPARVHVAGTSTHDDVVLGGDSDLLLLGARTLEGLNFRLNARAQAAGGRRTGGVTT